MSSPDNSHHTDDGSDNESFSHELSPTNGYFQPNEIPQRMISDPTDKTSQEAGKETGKHEDQSPAQQMHTQLNTSAQTTWNHRYPSSHPAAASSNRGVDDPQIHPQPIFDQPPPTYMASVEAAPTLSQAQQSAISYNTFLHHRIEEDSGRQPQSMGPVDGSNANERTPLWRNHTPREHSRVRTIIKKFLALALMLAILAGILSSFFISSNSRSKLETAPHHVPADSIFCPSTFRMEQYVFELQAPTGLVILQEFHDKVQHHGMQHVRTSGEVRIQRLPNNSQHGEKAHIALEVKVSDPALALVKLWDSDTGIMRMSTPLYARLNSDHSACISLVVTVWLPEDTELSHVLFDLVTLSIQTANDVNIKVSGETELKTISGHVKFANDRYSSFSQAPISEYRMQSRSNARFDSRHITIETVSGKIEGTYPLYDLLKLTSQSGMIGVNVYPEPVLESAPAPATLDIHTAAGRIEVRSPINVPAATYPREYITYVRSYSGAINGDFYVGSTGTFETTSSRIELQVKPVMPATSDEDEFQNQFMTASINGAIQVTLLEPLFVLPSAAGLLYSEHVGDLSIYHPGITELSAPGDLHIYKSKLRTFFSTHKSTSSRLEIYYPPQWIGNLEAKSISGRIEVSGEGVEIVKRTEGWGYKELKARKGVERDEDGGFVTLQTVSGAIAFDITP